MSKGYHHIPFRERVRTNRKHYAQEKSKPENYEAVEHGEDCPECGRPRVNVYLKDGVRKCKKCWEHVEVIEYGNENG